MSRHSDSGQLQLEVAEGEPAKRVVARASPKSGAQADRLVVMSHRFRPEILAGERHSEVVPAVGGMRLQGKRASEPRQSFIKLTQVGESDAEIHLSVERIGRELERSR